MTLGPTPLFSMATEKEDDAGKGEKGGGGFGNDIVGSRNDARWVSVIRRHAALQATQDFICSVASILGISEHHAGQGHFFRDDIFQRGEGEATFYQRV